MPKRILIPIIAAAVVIVGIFWYKNTHNKREIILNIAHDIKHLNPANTPPQDTSLPEKVLLSVPFTSQAPFAEWSDQEYDSACEEANILMAYYWTQGDSREKIPAQEAKDKIAAEIAFEQQNYNFSYDSSAEDTVKWASSFFHYDKFKLEKDVSVDEIKKQLAAGNVVLGFMDGQKLGNPNYTAPGPVTHVLLFKGYDQSTGEFITNDSGTRKGESYRYDYDVIDNALRDYSTGNHEPITSIHKDIIVVSK